MAQSLKNPLSPEHPCWSDLDTLKIYSELCTSGRCRHSKILVNFQDVTRKVHGPLVRRTLVAAQMWCRQLNIKELAITVQEIRNHPGQSVMNLPKQAKVAF
jgi:hypothetical protein